MMADSDLTAAQSPRRRPRCDQTSANWAWQLGRDSRDDRTLDDAKHPAPFIVDSDHYIWWYAGRKGQPFQWEHP